MKTYQTCAALTILTSSILTSSYGMLHSPGLPLTNSLVMARAAGAGDPALDRAIEASTESPGLTGLQYPHLRVRSS